MPKFFTHQGLGALCFVLLVFSLSTEALAQHAANQVLTQRDLSSFRSIAEDTLAIVDMGNLKRAKSRIKGLEAAWDRADPKLRPGSPEKWRKIDKARRAYRWCRRPCSTPKDRPKAGRWKGPASGAFSAKDAMNNHHRNDEC